MKKLMLGLMMAFAVTAFADPSVKINKVETANPWDGTKGTIKVDYSLSGIDAEGLYEVAFDVTAGGQTASVTNDAAILTEGPQPQKVIETAKLFGGETVAKDAEVKITLIWVFGGVQLWEGGPFFAECNVGATKPEEYGWYFWWGDTVGYKRNANNDGWVSVVDGKTTISFDNSAPANSTYGKNASELKSGGWVDNGNLVSTNDAATAKLGALWRMMTDSELQAFTESSDDKKVCNWTWTERNGVKGYLVTGAKDGYEDKSIFLPAAGIGGGSDLSSTGHEGRYWSSTPYSSNGAQYLNFDKFSFYGNSNSRYRGLVVRPVRGSAEGSSKVVATADADFWLGPGCKSCPWTVGDDVTAYITGEELDIEGTGEMYDFASAEDVPWAAFVDDVTAVTIAQDVTKVGKNSLSGFDDKVTANGTPLSFYDMMAGARGSAEPAEPPAGAVTSWTALTNAIATAESGAVIAVGADITEANGELVIPKDKEVTIKLYGKTVKCGRVTVGGALTVGDAEDSVGKIVASDGAKIAKSGSVTLLGGTVRGTFTAQNSGVMLLVE